MASQHLSAPTVTAPIPFTERERLQALYDTALLDSRPDPEFDAITMQAAILFGCPFALISLVDRHRLWFLSKAGLTVNEAPRSASLCSHVILLPAGDILFVPDARLDVRSKFGVVVAQEPFVRFYAGTPIVTRDGHSIGVLCVLDALPRQSCSEPQRDGLTRLAQAASRRVNAILDANSKGFSQSQKPIDAHVGQRLLELRARRGMTQNRLAFELGVPARTIKRVESGELRIPADQLLILSNVLNAPISYFFETFSKPK